MSASARHRSSTQACLALSEIAQHVALHQRLVARMADAEADSAVLVAAMGGDRAQAVMAGIAAADLHAEFRRRKIELVVEDRHVARAGS